MRAVGDTMIISPPLIIEKAEADRFLRAMGAVMEECGRTLAPYPFLSTVVLGAGIYLSHLLNELPGRIRLIFQPAEEGPPVGEDGGAEMMIGRSPGMYSM